MQRKKITPAIKGEFEYLEEEQSHFDKYRISVNGTLTAFLYMPRNAHLIPRSITFKEEIIIETVY